MLLLSTEALLSVFMSFFYIRHLSNLHPQHNGLRSYIQPCILYLACPENFSTLPVCVQKIGLSYMIGIYAARNHRERAGHPKAVISMGGHHECVRIHYILHRVSIIGTVVKSPVEGHGGHISDCA